MRGKRTVTGLFLVLAVVSGVGWATDGSQEEQQAVGGLAFLEEVEVTVVNIEVFVRDKDGKPVTDLGIDDFEVFQDGQPRKLTNFLFIDESFRPTAQELAFQTPTPVEGEATPSPSPGEAAASRPEIKPIHIVVFIDNENLRPFDRNRVLGHVRRFLADTVRPGVEAMIVAYQGSAKILQPFSSDPRQLADALNAMRKNTGGRVNRDSARAALQREIARLQQEDSYARGDDSMSQKAATTFDDIIAYADSVAAETVRDINAVSRMTATLSGLPGRKYMIYVSSGVPMVPAKDLFFEFTQRYSFVNYNSMIARYNQRNVYRSLAESANAQGVTFYTIDAQGLVPNAGISADRGVAGDPSAGVINDINYEEPLYYIAERTGGLATVGTNNFAGGLDLVRDDLFTYYSLGYPITAAGGDRVHRVEVRLRDRKDLELRYRQTFVEKSRESQVQDKVITALLFDVAENPMGIEASVGDARPTQEGRWLLPLRVAFPTESVALLPQGESLVGEVVVFVSLRDDTGRQADIQRREQAIHLPRSDYERLAKLELSVDVELLVEPGSYRVAVGLLDGLTRQASYEVLSASTPGQ